MVKILSFISETKYYKTKVKISITKQKVQMLDAFSFFWAFPLSLFISFHWYFVSIKRSPNWKIVEVPHFTKSVIIASVSANSNLERNFNENWDIIKEKRASRSNSFCKIDFSYSILTYLSYLLSVSHLIWKQLLD